MSAETGHVAIVGAGTMGWQIALCLGARGVTVRLHDLAPDTLRAAMQRIVSEADRMEHEGEIERASWAADRIRPDAELGSAVAGAWLVIEAIPERLELKRPLFAEFSRLADAETVLATNSSSFRSRDLADVTTHPERLLNTHFYNLPWRRPAVELMTCGATDPAVLERGAAFFTTIGMTPFVVRGESTGFLFNRIWRAIKRESLLVAAEGLASPAEIDRIWQIVLEQPLGPFALMDRVGLDVVLDIERHYAHESGDPRDDPPTLLIEMVNRGDLGQKSGRGFYDYPGGPASRSE